MVGGLAMDTHTLRKWIEDTHGDLVVKSPGVPISTKVLRFRWGNDLTVATGSNASGKTKINAVIDGLAWWINEGQPDVDLNVLVGWDPVADKDDEEGSTLLEQLGAIGSI